MLPPFTPTVGPFASPPPQTYGVPIIASARAITVSTDEEFADGAKADRTSFVIDSKVPTAGTTCDRSEVAESG